MNQNYSYWELDSYFKRFDLIVIGSGIVGLSTAISFKEKNTKANVLIIEREVLSNGASSKNAGFACFGTVGEILDDLTHIPESTVWETVETRYKGLQMLKRRVKPKNMDYQQLGGFEVFQIKDEFQSCAEEITNINLKIAEVLQIKNCFSPTKKADFGFRNFNGMIQNKHEGQIDSGKMMQTLSSLAIKSGISILRGVAISSFVENGSTVELYASCGTFKANKVVIATNGFANQLLSNIDLKPARAQVLVTSPIVGLKLKGCFHFDKGYYYFRNINNRVLFGGGRNLDFKNEETAQLGLNEQIQKHLTLILRESVLPNHKFEVEHRWSGIMGVGTEKKPIIQKVGKNVLAAVRMGGMGVAIGTWVGEEAAKEIS